MALKRRGFERFDAIKALFERVLESSVADETELVWLERRTGEASSTRDSPRFLENPRLSVLIRVVEGGRQGWYRTDNAGPFHLEAGVRQALALAKARPRIERRPILPKGGEEFRAPRQLLDREIGRLEPEEMHERLRQLAGRDERLRVSWSEARLVIHNNHGLRMSAALSEATLESRVGGPEGALVAGCGRAAASARRLADLDFEAIRERARQTAPAEPATAPVAPPPAAVPVLLSSEATIACLNLLNAHAFSGRSFLDGTSFLCRHRNVQVFDRKLHLRDDGTATGLALPFDFEGSLKRPLDLIVEGKPSTPALNQAQGAEAGLEPTGQAVGGQDALFCNLFLLPGEAGDRALLGAADGGLRISWLEDAECYEPSQLRVRAIARGVRRIADGRLAEPVEDFVWEESLLAAFGRLRSIGRAPAVLAESTTPLGAISAPALVLEGSNGFQPLPAAGHPPRPRLIPTSPPPEKKSGNEAGRRSGRRPGGARERNRRSRGRSSR